MPRNERKKHCSARTAAGAQCRAWSMHGDVLCSAHARRNAGAGAPVGNKNRYRHGFYSQTFTPAEIAALVAAADNNDLTDEIAVIRILTRRLFNALSALSNHKPDQSSPELTDQLATLASLVNSAARTTARLLRDQKALGGNSLDDAITAALDQLSDEFDIEM